MIATCWHFAYGIWLFAAKWGITPGDKARQRFGYVCAAGRHGPLRHGPRRHVRLRQSQVPQRARRRHARATAPASHQPAYRSNLSHVASTLAVRFSPLNRFATDGALAPEVNEWQHTTHHRRRRRPRRSLRGHQDRRSRRHGRPLLHRPGQALALGLRAGRHQRRQGPQGRGRHRPQAL